jgi:hypothetical protein
MSRYFLISVTIFAVAACSGAPAGTDGGVTSSSGGSAAGGSSTGHGVSAGGSSSGAASSGSTGVLAGSSSSGSSGGSSGGGTTSGGSSAGGASTGSTGTPPSSCTLGAATDACAPYGYVCTLQSDGKGKCELPTELVGCLPSVGCASAPLQCTSVAGVNLCIRSCNTTDDCPDAFSTCQPLNGANACLYDACGASSAAAYGSCDSIGTGDGICLPDVVGRTCVQTGGQASESACSTERGSNGDVSQLCSSGYFCIPNSTGSTTGVCEPLCEASNSGPTRPGCSNGQFCWAIDSNLFDWGVCLTSCSIPFVSSCPSGKVCILVGSQGNGCLP